MRRATFDNRRFWNLRYVEDPDKGSGPGSRGDNLALKNRLIGSIVERHQIGSVLDIGCGDIEVVKSAKIRSYVGVDISDVVIERNRRIKPEWQFVCADLAGSYCPPRADLVLCMDVLIHQRSRKAYFTILSKVLDATKKIALISGHSRPDPGWNVFYHEPIADSIRRFLPSGQIEKVAEYRSTDLLKVER